MAGRRGAALVAGRDVNVDQAHAARRQDLGPALHGGSKLRRIGDRADADRALRFGEFGEIDIRIEMRWPIHRFPRTRSRRFATVS